MVINIILNNFHIDYWKILFEVIPFATKHWISVGDHLLQMRRSSEGGTIQAILIIIQIIRLRSLSPQSI